MRLPGRPRAHSSATRYHRLPEYQQTMENFLVRLLKSFVYALQGMAMLVRTQPNARIHLLATLLVCGAGFYFGLSRMEWLWVVVAMVLVWSAEAFNTAVEQLADTLHPEQHPGIGRAKDAAAAGVLIAAMGAAVIGVLVFLPHFIHMGWAMAAERTMERMACMN